MQIIAAPSQNPKLCARVLIVNEEGEKTKKKRVFKFSFRLRSGCLFAQMQSLSGCSDWQLHIFYLNHVFAELGDNCTEHQGANTVASCFSGISVC